jgi:hypothetical protein
MTKLSAFVLLGISLALSGTCASFAQQTNDKPVTPPKTVTPPPLKDAHPTPGTTRSLHKSLPPPSAAPAPGSKSDSSSPDDTVGGLPGAKPVTDEKQP